MSEFQLRQAVPGDWQTIVAYNCRLAEETEQKSLDPQTVSAGVKRVLTDASKGRYFVASSGEQVVGQLLLTSEWSDWRNGDLWWLQSVYVLFDYRRRGVFRMLYRHVRMLAESRSDVVGLRLYVDEDNHRARETYRQLGMREVGYRVMEEVFD